MRNYILIAIVAAFFGNSKACCQANDSTLTRLLSIDVGLYVNKPLDSIIAILPAGFNEMRVVGTRTTARNLRVMYANRVWIDLHVRQFSFMNPVDNNRTWNMALMRKEKLFKIAIYKGVNCYVGCPAY